MQHSFVRFTGATGVSLVLTALLASCGGGGGSGTGAASGTNVESAPKAAPQARPRSSDGDFAQLSHIVMMGQSLASGEESFPILTTQDTGFGSVQFKRGIHTWREEEGEYCLSPEKRPATDFNLVPIIAGEPGTATGETIASGMADQLKVWTNTSARFLVSYSGQGARRLRDLDKRHDDASDPRNNRQTMGGHYRTGIDDVRRAQAQAEKLGLSYAVSALTWMQGEAETGDYRINDWTPPLQRQALLETYASDLINLKEDWNNDVRAITGQSRRIPMFTYQTRGAVSGQAQLIAAERDPEVVMVSPTYYMYSALNSERGADKGNWGNWIHITGESERWLGAQYAKVMKQVIADKKPWQPLRPLKAWAEVDRKTIYVRYAVPAPPLVIDTQFLPAAKGAGYAIPGGPSIASVRLAAPDVVALELQSALPEGQALTLQYAADAQASELLQVPGTIKAVRQSAPWPNGQESFEVVYAGDLRPALAGVMKTGVFHLINKASAGQATSAAIREVILDGQGNTVFRGEARELYQGIQFKAGQETAINAVFMIGNVRDSDSTQSMYRFETGPRKGEPYPLWNWSVAFADLPIDAN